MATGVTVYRSTDSGAPVLNGLAGSLCTVLDAILVDGYGSKTAAGWTQVLTGPISGKRLYKAGAGALKPYLRVHDDAQNLFALGREARIRAFETESSFDLNIGAYPNQAQAANGIIFYKSAWSDSTARPWVCVADSRTFYFFCLPGDYAGYSSFMFGEYYSLKTTADNYNSIIIGRVTERTSAVYALASQETLDALSAVTAATAGHFVPRTFGEYYQPAIPVGKHGNAAHSTTGLFGLTVYPNPVDNGLYLSQVWVHEPYPAAVIRGRMRGFWHFLHPVGVQVNDGDTWNGTGPLAGKTFMAIKPTASGTGVFVLEISDTWETN